MIFPEVNKSEELRSNLNQKMMKGVKSEPGKDCSDQKPSNNPAIASIAAASSENAPFQGKGNDLMISTGIREDHRKIHT